MSQYIVVTYIDRYSLVIIMMVDICEPHTCPCQFPTWGRWGTQHMTCRRAGQEPVEFPLLFLHRLMTWSGDRFSRKYSVKTPDGIALVPRSIDGIRASASPGRLGLHAVADSQTHTRTNIIHSQCESGRSGGNAGDQQIGEISQVAVFLRFVDRQDFRSSITTYNYILSRRAAETMGIEVFISIAQYYTQIPGEGK